MELVRSQPLGQADRWRWESWFSSSGMGCGVCQFLAESFTVSIGLEARVSKIGLPVHLDWYPLEGVLVSFGFDGIGWRPVGSISFQP